MPPSSDIRWNVALAGGSLMDLGCYPIRWLRDVLGVVPSVTSATASDRDGIDASMDAQPRLRGRARPGARRDVGHAARC
jgi:predicted dehydrogenase